MTDSRVSDEIRYDGLHHIIFPTKNGKRRVALETVAQLLATQNVENVVLDSVCLVFGHSTLATDSLVAFVVFSTANCGRGCRGIKRDSASLFVLSGLLKVTNSFSWQRIISYTATRYLKSFGNELV